jgi:Flp pilus assembly protein TadB
MKLTPAMIVLIATALCLMTALEAWGSSRRRRIRRMHERQSQKQESATEDEQDQPAEPEDASDEPESDEAIEAAGGSGAGGGGSSGRPSKPVPATPDSTGINWERQFGQNVVWPSLAVALVALLIVARLISWARRREGTQGHLSSQSGP